MQLTSLQIENFRKFDSPVRLEGLGAGINVLAAPNEFGKSTLLAALKTVLFQQHRVRGRIGESMCHVRNATSPVISLGFEISGGLYNLEKRFMHRDAYARLQLPDGSRLEGDAAEERLQSILGFGAPGRTGATPDSVGLWGALWVAQQEALRQPALAASSRTTLHGCLEAELGALAGSDRSAGLISQVKAELFLLLDGHSRPKGRFKEVAEEILAIDAALVQSSAKRSSLEEAVGASARLKRDLAQSSDADVDRKVADDLDEARRRRDAALQHRHVLQGAVAALGLAERNEADATAEVERRTFRRDKIETAGIELDTACTEEIRLLEEQVAAEALSKVRRDAVRAAEAASIRAAQALKAAHAVSALVMRAGHVVRLGGTLERAMAAQSEVNRLAGELAANPADATRLRSVTAAAATLDRARSMLDARATDLAVDLVPEAATRVQIDGSALPAGSTLLRVVDTTTIDIAGIGRIRVRPAIRDRVTLQAAVTSAEAALAAALLEIGAFDAVEAARMAAARAGIAEQLSAAEARLKVETPGDPALGLKPGLDALRHHVDAGREQLTAQLAALGLTSLPAMGAADGALDRVKSDEEEAASALQAARLALVGPEAEHERAALSQQRAVAAAGQACSVLVALQRDHDAALAVETDEAIAARREAARIGLIAQRERVAQLQRDNPADTVDGMDARIKRLEGAGKLRLETVRVLREEIAAVTARIRASEGEGVDEQIAELERRQSALVRERTALEDEAAVLTLLRDTLAEAEREARERYVAPVLRRVTPYLQALLPGVEISLGDDLQITHLTRQAGVEDLDRLSDGTVEQVAVLLRLAYADLLVDRGKPAMMILDDALAYSDSHRLEAMFDTLTRASERMQILVLTCRTDIFSRLGGNRLRLVEA